MTQKKPGARIFCANLVTNFSERGEEKMKKALIFIAGALLLTACFPIQATQSEDEINTRVAQVLTSFPTSTAAPTFPPTYTPVPPTETLQPSPTATQQQATATPLLAQPTTGATLNATQAAATTQTAAVASATVTFTPNPTYASSDPRSTLGNPTWSDPMDDARNWPTGVNEFTSIAFNSGELALTTLSNVSGWRLAGTISLNSVYIEQTGKLVTCADSDSYGIIFRVPVLAESNKGYLFGITCDGQYYLKSFDATRTPDTIVIVQPTSNPAIVAGSGKTNRIGVWAKGNTIKLYANGILLHELTDSTFSQGYFGVFIRKSVTDGLTSRITEMNYWILP
jgi:hypothetical protein